MNHNRDTSSVLKTCHSITVDPEVEQHAAIMRVPVVLAETCIETMLDAKIHFPEPVLDIIKIKKQLRLTQCKLLLPSNRLYIKGYVRKNIQYTTPISPLIPSSTIQLTLRSFTIDVPFKCVTKIEKFLIEPSSLVFSDEKQFGFWINPNQADQVSDKYQSTPILSEGSQEYNELPYCVLLSSKINEWDQVLNRQPLPDRGHCEETFTCLEEQMVLEFVIQIIQRQNIQPFKPYIPTPKPTPFPMGEESVEELFIDSIEDSLEEAFEKFFKGSTKGKKIFDDNVPFSVESSIEDSAQGLFDELINRPINQSFKEFYDKNRHEHSSGNPGELDEGSDSFEGSFEKIFKSSFLELEESTQSSNVVIDGPIENSFDRFFKPSFKGAIPRFKDTIEESNGGWELDPTKESFVDSEEQWDKDSTKESFVDSSDPWDKDSTKESLEDSLESFDIDLLDE